MDEEKGGYNDDRWKKHSWKLKNTIDYPCIFFSFNILNNNWFCLSSDDCLEPIFPNIGMWVKMQLNPFILWLKYDICWDSVFFWLKVVPKIKEKD